MQGDLITVSDYVIIMLLLCAGVGIRDPISGEVPKAARRGGLSTRTRQVHGYYVV